MDNELVDLVMEDTRERMARALEHVKAEFATVRTGRASSALIENLIVDYYGTETALRSPGQLLGPRATAAGRLAL